MKFGDYIRQKREELGLTQPEAAARAEIEQSYLSKLETGKSYPSEDIFGRLMTAYGIKAEDLCGSVFSAELDKLREIKEVRATVLKRQKGEARLMRGWLLAGLAMITIGGAAMGLTQTVSDQKQTYYQYLSEGVIREGEALNIFEHLEHGEATAEQSHQLAKRINFDYRTTTDFRGTVFIEQVEGGLRRYHVYADGVEVNASPFKWLLLPSSIMLLFGGLACFYIARRWR